MTKKTVLHEIIAVEPDRIAARTAIHAETITTFTKKAEHFIGKHSIYKPLEEGAAPSEETVKELVDTVHGKLEHFFSVALKAIDLTLTKDIGNTLAQAEVLIDGVAITPPLPATSLLMLESQLKHWHELFSAIPTLSPGRSWVLDPSRGAHIYLDPVKEIRPRTRKVQQFNVVVPPTENHPAQVREWTSDEKIGVVEDTAWCSMLSPAEKSRLLSRTSDLLAAIKQARQRANMQEVTQVSLSRVFADYVLG